MKKILVLIAVVLMSKLAIAQQKAQHLMTTNKAEYNGWKIKKGTQIPLTDGDTGIIQKMDWYSVQGVNVLYATIKNKAGEQIDFDLEGWVLDGKIILPNGISKLPERKRIEPDGISTDGDTLITGYELFRGLKGAGNELNIYANQQKTANAMQVVGALTSITGLALSANGESYGPYVAAGGVVIGLVAWIVGANAQKHIGYAGNFLQGIVPLNNGKKKVRYID